MILYYFPIAQKRDKGIKCEACRVLYGFFRNEFNNIDNTGRMLDSRITLELRMYVKKYRFCPNVSNVVKDVIT